MNTSRRLMVGAVLLAGFTAAITAQNAGPDWPQWRGPRRDGTLTVLHRAEGMARDAQSALEDHRRRGLRHADRGRKPRVSVLTPGGERNPARHRRRHRQGDLGAELRRALRDEFWREASWSRPEIDPDIRRWPAVHARHEQHRDGMGRGERQRAVAKAGRSGSAEFPHGHVAARRSRRR